MNKTCPAVLGVSFLPEMEMKKMYVRILGVIQKNNGIERDLDITMRCHLGDKPESAIT